jgi:S-adenosylmethionine:tRNA ribosyltransferase-isomerase
MGTTVVRALEGAAASHAGELRPGVGTTDLIVGPETERQVVDGIVTGMHESTSSHFRLLQAFAPSSLLERARDVATERGYLDHEFGDLMLVLSSATPV